MSNKNTIKKKKIREDCYALDRAWLIWLKERLPVYLRDADGFIDLAYHQEGFTQKEAIIEMISLVNYLLNPEVDDWSDEYQNKCDKLTSLWADWWRGLWW